MLIDIPEHYAPNIGGAMVHRAADVIMSTRIVPAWMHQYADLWDKGLKYGYDGTFWEAVCNHEPRTHKTITREGLL